eukprot:363231-Chlamydomonas_euryale.AAC.4
MRLAARLGRPCSCRLVSMSDGRMSCICMDAGSTHAGGRHRQAGMMVYCMHRPTCRNAKQSCRLPTTPDWRSECTKGDPDMPSPP